MNLFNVEYSDFEILEALSDTSYDMEYSKERSDKILNEFTRRHQLNDCDFKENHWILHDNTAKNRVHLNFEEIQDLSMFISNTDLVTIVKCWVSTFLEQDYAPRTISDYLNNFKKVLLMSKGFNDEVLDEIKDYFKYEISPRTRIDYCLASLNFLDYFPFIDINGCYAECFWETKHNTNIEDNVRTLPSSHDVLKFSMIIENYFNSTLKDEEFLRFFPIFLWWNLTNIIPIRISEFCGIERNCLIEKGQNVYIKIPRSKQHLSREKNIDDILIPKYLSEEIKRYINKSEGFGDTSTLISYISIPKYSEGYKHLKIELDVFNSTNMMNLLKAFYNDVVFDKYGFVFFESDELINKQKTLNSSKIIYRKIRLNDTRHFAFLNLLIQGYHPVEIARLGGHNSIQSQYHYHAHMEYWVDSEVMKLALKFNTKTNITSSVNSMKEYINEDDISFKEKFILRPPTTNTKIDLEIGYCTDPYQRCFVDEHFFCDYWRISFDEYKEKAGNIQAKIIEKQQETTALLDSLRNLHILGIKESKNSSYLENSTIYNKQLSETSKQLRKALIELARVKERMNNFES